MIKKFLVAALTAVVFASSAEALSVKHDFTAFVGPFNASTAEFEYTLTKKSYAVRSVVRTNGTFGFLYPFEANYYTGGSIEGDRLETSAYRYTSQSRFNKRSKVMIYNEDGQPGFCRQQQKRQGKEKRNRSHGRQQKHHQPANRAGRHCPAIQPSGLLRFADSDF